MLKVILKENIPGQGKRGDVLNVSEGFFRNFLLPKNKAFIASNEEIKKMEEEKAKNQIEENKKFEKDEEIKELIEKSQIEIKKKTSGEKKLFGSLTQKEISDVLLEKKIDISAKQVSFKSPIKETGDYEVEILLSKNLKAVLKLAVKKQG